MSVTSLAVAREQPQPERDEVSIAVDRLSQVLPFREDSKVLLEFLEDALREGLDAVEHVEEHYAEVLGALHDEPGAPLKLVEVADDVVVLEKIETLLVSTREIYRRLSQAAGKMRGR